MERTGTGDMGALQTCDTVVADGAVDGARGPVEIARVAELELDGAAVDDDVLERGRPREVAGAGRRLLARDDARVRERDLEERREVHGDEPHKARDQRPPRRALEHNQAGHTASIHTHRDNGEWAGCGADVGVEDGGIRTCGRESGRRGRR